MPTESASKRDPENHASPLCDRCGERGRPVLPRTVKSILRNPLTRSIPPSGLRVCRTPGCPVLYFGPGGWEAALTAARVRVGIKRPDDGDALVCYCFDVTVADLRDEVARDGGENAIWRISRGIEAGDCACEVLNPSGSCCLGEVRRVLGRLHADGERTTCRSACGSPEPIGSPDSSSPSRTGAAIVPHHPVHPRKQSLRAGEAADIMARRKA